MKNQKIMGQGTKEICGNQRYTGVDVREMPEDKKWGEMWRKTPSSIRRYLCTLWQKGFEIK